MPEKDTKIESLKFETIKILKKDGIFAALVYLRKNSEIDTYDCYKVVQSWMRS